MTERPSTSSSQRNYGIDALRLFSMFSAVLLHILGSGGILRSTSGAKLAIAWFLEISAYSCVNCFGIISGYTAYSDKERPHPFRKYLSLWIQVFFYSLGIVLLYNRIDSRAVSYNDIYTALMPVSRECYWYFSAYTALFFLMPWLNMLMRACTQRQAHQLIAVLILIFSFCPILFKNEALFGLASGYSFVWLAVLYLIGAWMKKCAIPARIRCTRAFAFSMLCVLFTWIQKICFNVHSFISYISPTVLLHAILLFILFSRANIKGLFQKLIICFSPAAFGVYLIHVHPFAWRILIENRYHHLAQSATLLFPILVLSCSFALFIICLLVEKTRLILFHLFRINIITDKFCDGVHALICKKQKQHP